MESERESKRGRKASIPIIIPLQYLNHPLIAALSSAKKKETFEKKNSENQYNYRDLFLFSFLYIPNNNLDLNAKKSFGS